MAYFPDTPSFTGFNTPSRIEADIVNLVHQGTIPPELDGAFYRGPTPRTSDWRHERTGNPDSPAPMPQVI